ncbi:hypothetical protein CLOP_g2620 [Closterium sp. NIES-67]|nr:hypothetical protein CLOP_g2620 [Closterium sp. NIES-67]
MRARDGMQRAWRALSALWLTSVVSSCRAQTIHASQAVFLTDCQNAWARTFEGWTQGANCSAAYGLECDGSGMITRMIISNNSLTGSIPDSISSLTALTQLDLSDNKLSGSIPTGVGKLSRLKELSLRINSLTGSIPNSISSLTALTRLHLSVNRLTEPIPAGIGNLTSLQTLSLRINSLMGSIPDSISLLTALTRLELSTNILDGPIPAGIGKLSNLEELSLSSNKLSGPIPDSIGSLSKLVVLSLDDNNNLSGPIPTSAGGLSNLKEFNIDGTNLTCPADNSCGQTQSPSIPALCKICGSFCTCGLSKGAIVGIAAAAVVILLLLLAAILLYFKHKRQKNSKVLCASLAAAHCTEFSLAEVLKATNNWSRDNQLGSGAFGDVYKGVSPRDGTTVWAVKRAKLIDVDFHREVQQMADKNHPNIVRLLGFAVGGDLRTRPEQVLIYEYVPNGDLEKWIDSKLSSPLSLQQRLGILVGAARGFEYLHRFGIVHRDIKPANILIGDDMQAKIADFGLLRVGEGTTVGITRIMGTPGYVDPVYSRTSKTTTATDVYSFGVLMLVVVTGRPPLSESYGESSHILSWVSECLSSNTIASLKTPGMDAPEAAMLRVAELAISCTVERTASRPTMAHVANELQAIREEVVGKDELIAAVKVDAEVQEMNASVELNLESQLQLIGDSFQAEIPV